MLTGLLIFLALLTALLAIPIAFNFQLNWPHELGNTLEMSWLFGLVRVNLLRRKKKPESAAGSSKKKDKPVKPSSSKKGGASVFRVLLRREFRQRVTKYISDLWRSIKMENLKLRLRAGLDDPADTGQLWAFIGPLAGVLGAAQQHSVSIEPDFLSAGLELDTSGSISFSPLMMLLISFGLLLSPSFWRGVSEVRAAR